MLHQNDCQPFRYKQYSPSKDQSSSKLLLEIAWKRMRKCCPNYVKWSLDSLRIGISILSYCMYKDPKESISALGLRCWTVRGKFSSCYDEQEAQASTILKFDLGNSPDCFEEFLMRCFHMVLSSSECHLLINSGETVNSFLSSSRFLVSTHMPFGEEMTSPPSQLYNNVAVAYT